MTLLVCGQKIVRSALLMSAVWRDKYLSLQSQLAPMLLMHLKSVVCLESQEIQTLQDQQKPREDHTNFPASVPAFLPHFDLLSAMVKRLRKHRVLAG